MKENGKKDSISKTDEMNIRETLIKNLFEKRVVIGTGEKQHQERRGSVKYMNLFDVKFEKVRKFD